MEIEITTNILNDIFGLKNRIRIPEKDSILLRDLFDFWMKEYGRKPVERVYDDSGLKDELVLLINDKNVVSLSGLETEICDGDRIVILSAVTGG